MVKSPPTRYVFWGIPFWDGSPWQKNGPSQCRENWAEAAEAWNLGGSAHLHFQVKPRTTCITGYIIYIYISIYLPIYLSIYLSIHPSIHPSIHLQHDTTWSRNHGKFRHFNFLGDIPLLLSIIFHWLPHNVVPHSHFCKHIHPINYWTIYNTYIYIYIYICFRHQT